jgi:hypothetical protein
MPVETPVRYASFSQERERRQETQELVTSDNFWWSLLPYSPVPASADDFASELDLGAGFASAFRRIAPHVPEGIGGGNYALGRDQEESSSGNYAIARQRSPFSNGEERKGREQGFSIYFDPEDSQPHASDVITGEEGADQVNLDIFDHIAAGKYPLGGAHNHLRPGSLSADDIASLFLQRGAYTDPILRPARAAFVSCPDIQILAATTQQTPPPLPPEQFEAFLDYWNMRLQNEDRDAIDALVMQAKQIRTQGKVLWEQERDSKMAELVGRVASGTLRESEQVSLQAELSQIKARVNDGYNPVSLPEYSAARQAVQATEQQAYNRVHVEMMRATGLAWFTSHDFQHFTKVTA